MRVHLLILFLLVLVGQCFAQDQGRILAETIKDYAKLQSELDGLLKIKSPDCLPGTISTSLKNYCSIKDMCTKREVRVDDPILYINEKGEKIINENYYFIRDGVRTCLKEKYADVIKERRDELAAKLRTIHLQKIIDANKLLIKLSDKYNQGTKIQKISAEILTISLESAMRNEESEWQKDKGSHDELAKVIAQAEKRTKISLNSEVKKTLIEIHYLKFNATYPEEVARFEDAIIPQTKINDPFYDWSLLKDEKVAGGPARLAFNRAKLTEKSQEAYALFQETQKEMVSYLESKKNESNVDNMDRIISRVKTIRFNPPRLTNTLTTVCESPNAFYSAKTHSFTICPQMLNFPKIALMETIAHEIAHSYDSCNFSGKMYQKKGPLIIEEAPFEVEIKTEPINGNYRNTFDDDPTDLKLKDKIQEKIKYADHPFAKTLSCLQDPASVGAKAIDPADITKKAKASLEALIKLGQNTPENSKARYVNYLITNQKDYFDYFQGCNNIESSSVLRSQLQEAFADKMATEIVARKLQSASKVDAEKSMLEISLGYNNICSNEGQSNAKIREFAAKNGCKNFYENKTNEEKILNGISISDPEFDPHPNSALRIERNLMSHPIIRKALNCPIEKGLKYCE